MDDLPARLDRAITEAQHAIIYSAQMQQRPAKEHTEWGLDRYATLVALRARYEEHDRAHYGEFERPLCGRCPELDAEAERVLGEGA